MQDYTYRFTVFTPTYNREHLIHRVFESLMKQTYRDFEWIVVDDGSTDNTKKVIEDFQKKAWFSIRYIYQENGGKHRAINRGVKEADGELFLIFDSDDWCVENALERFDYHWKNIPQKDIFNFFAVCALCMYQNGKIVGTIYPKNIYDSNFIQLRLTQNRQGDLWIASKTELIKKHSFPEFEDENYIAESSVWNEVSKFYKTRFINEALEIVEYQSDGLSNNSKRIRKESCFGSMYCYSEQFYFDIPTKVKIKAIINCLRFTLHHNRARSICFKKIYTYIMSRIFNRRDNEKTS